MGDLSPHFSTAEFCCKHCGRIKVSGLLLAALEELRALGPEPIIVNDAYRCPEHNVAVGGVPDSQHDLGTAADIRVTGLTVEQMYHRATQVQTFRDGGIGVYDGGFIHVDVRQGEARWARVGSKYVAIHRLIPPAPDVDGEIGV